MTPALLGWQLASAAGSRGPPPAPQSPSRAGRTEPPAPQRSPAAPVPLVVEGARRGMLEEEERGTHGHVTLSPWSSLGVPGEGPESGPGPGSARAAGGGRGGAAPGAPGAARGPARGRRRHARGGGEELRVQIVQARAPARKPPCWRGSCRARAASDRCAGTAFLLLNLLHTTSKRLGL